MRAWALLMLVTTGLATPVAVDAKPRDAVIAAAQVQPGVDLNQVLSANGWTVLALPSDIYKPGMLFQPGSSSSEGTCVDATPITADLPSIEAQGSKGFVVEGRGGVGVLKGAGEIQATSFKLKTSTDVEQAVIPGMDMKLNDRCLEYLQKVRAQIGSLAGWFVIQETVRARVKEIKCNTKEAAAKVRAMWIARGEVGAMSECMESYEGTGVIAYKGRPVVEFMPTQRGHATTSTLMEAEAYTPVKSPTMSEADMYNYGEGVARDVPRAAQLYEQACTRNELFGCAELSIVLFAGHGLFGGQRLAKDEPRAKGLAKRTLPFLRAQCSDDNPRACNLLSTMFARGFGVPKDDYAAVSLAQKACDGGFATGCSGLGALYEYGVGVPKDTTKAARYYKKGCDGRDSGGCARLGVFYKNGWGVPKAQDVAISLFQMACDQRHVDGCFQLAIAYQDGKGVNKNTATATHYYKLACDGGHWLACK